jgi:hypothetical protein
VNQWCSDGVCSGLAGSRITPRPEKIVGQVEGHRAAGSTGIGRKTDEPVGEALGEFMKAVAFSAGMAADLAVVEDQGQGIGQKPDHGQHHLESTFFCSLGKRRQRLNGEISSLFHV